MVLTFKKEPAFRVLETFVTRLVETGRCGSKSEVLREGVRLIQDREAQLAALGTVIERSLADSEAGSGKPANEVFDRLEAEYRGMAGESSIRRTRSARPSIPVHSHKSQAKLAV